VFLALERIRLCRVQAAFSYTSPPDWTAPLSGRGSYAAPSLCHDDSRLVGFSFFFVANFNRKMQKLPLFRAFQQEMKEKTAESLSGKLAAAEAAAVELQVGFPLFFCDFH
jgi:hypothetical protein